MFFLVSLSEASWGSFWGWSYQLDENMVVCHEMKQFISMPVTLWQYVIAYSTHFLMTCQWWCWNRSVFSPHSQLVLFRFYELESEYGRLNQLAQVEMAPQKTVTVQIVLEELNYSQPRIIRLDWTLKDLYSELAPIFGLSQDPQQAHKVAKQYLLIHHCSSYLVTNQMNLLDRTLMRYGVKDGDEIHIAKKIEIRRSTPSPSRGSPSPSRASPSPSRGSPFRGSPSRGSPNPCSSQKEELAPD